MDFNIWEAIIIEDRFVVMRTIESNYITDRGSTIFYIII